MRVVYVQVVYVRNCADIDTVGSLRSERWQVLANKEGDENFKDGYIQSYVHG